VTGARLVGECPGCRWGAEGRLSRRTLARDPDVWAAGPGRCSLTQAAADHGRGRRSGPHSGRPHSSVCLGCGPRSLPDSAGDPRCSGCGSAGHRHSGQARAGAGDRRSPIGFVRQGRRGDERCQQGDRRAGGPGARPIRQGRRARRGARLGSGLRRRGGARHDETRTQGCPRRGANRCGGERGGWGSGACEDAREWRSGQGETAWLRAVWVLGGDLGGERFGRGRSVGCPYRPVSGVGGAGTVCRLTLVAFRGGGPGQAFFERALEERFARRGPRRGTRASGRSRPGRRRSGGRDGRERRLVAHAGAPSVPGAFCR
jgi:hypothetical protein